MADRYTYVPLIGIFIAVSWGAAELGTASAARDGMSIVLCAAAACGALRSDPASGHPLGRATSRSSGMPLQVTSRNWLAHNNLGRASSPRGQVDEAIAEYGRALSISPGCRRRPLQLGDGIGAQGSRRGGDRAVRSGAAPRRPSPAHNNLGGVLAGRGQIDAAIGTLRPCDASRSGQRRSTLQHGKRPVSPGAASTPPSRTTGEALALRPDRAEVHNNLGTPSSEQGRAGEAIERHERGTAHQARFQRGSHEPPPCERRRCRVHRGVGSEQGFASRGRTR